MHKFLKVQPGVEKPEIVKCDKEEVPYEFLRKQIDGPIEYLEFKHNGSYYDIILHEEGKLINLPPALLVQSKGKTIDLVVGTFLVAKSNDEGATVGLKKSEIEELKEIMNPAKRSVISFKYGGLIPYIEI